jgi:Holliday junction resolvasome RuvABC endonuclease subunit
MHDLSEFNPKKTACIGIDPSLNGTGVAVIIDGCVDFVHGWTTRKKKQKDNPEYLSFYKIADAKDLGHRMHRLSISTAWVRDVIMHYRQAEGRPVVVAIEGYAISQHGQRVTDQHEGVGIIKNYLWERCIPFQIYPPQNIKIAATNKGNATKDQMVRAASLWFNIDLAALGRDGENLADALWIAALLYEELCLRTNYDSYRFKKYDQDGKRVDRLFKALCGVNKKLVPYHERQLPLAGRQGYSDVVYGKVPMYR